MIILYKIRSLYIKNIEKLKIYKETNKDEAKEQRKTTIRFIQ